MLFNSFPFILVYLPIVVAGFFTLCRYFEPWAALSWLTIMSLAFYAWWQPIYLVLLVGSIVFNYGCATGIVSPLRSTAFRKHLLILAVALNLICLGYFKYFNFFASAVAEILNCNVHLTKVSLPIGISFFTFTQIAFLVDAHEGKVRERSFVNYSLFVSYFPHLIAGPVLHHSEMMPQFASHRSYRFIYENVLTGLVYFLIGLIKKVVFADSISPFVDRAFDGADTLSFSEAWIGAWSYALQIYFDFSGYSDMAIGLSRIFNVDLPLNFNSPYKSKSIIEFWRRWHMTLSRFLRDYLYIPLGGNRNGPRSRFANLLLTMLLGGLWHGAGWTFVIWGGLHGIYLMINHGFRNLIGPVRKRILPSAAMGVIGSILTFAAVVVAWVFFRATDVQRATAILGSMAGLSPTTVTPVHYEVSTGFLPMLGSSVAPWACVLSLIAWFAPNSQYIMNRLQKTGAVEALSINPTFRIATIPAVYLLVVFCASINEVRNSVSPFIYFNF